jgi:two-component system, NarL family, sensor histidine kinase UhpB
LTSPRRHALQAFWHGRSVRTQLVLVFVLIDLIAVFIAGGVAIVRARIQARVEIAASMRLAEFLVGDAANLARQELPAEQFLAALPTQLQSIRHVRVAVRDAAGMALAATSPGERADTLRTPGRAPAPAWFTALVGSPIEAHFVPVIVNGRTIGQVEISGEPADEAAEFWQNMVAIAGVGVLLNAAMIGLLYVVFGRVLDPLTVLAAGLSDLERQSYNVRLPKPQARELGVISEHFNALAQALATARAENLQLSRRLITAQDDERRRTALELHDEVGPCLFGLKANASSIAGAAGALPDKARKGVTDRLHDILGIIEHLQAINRSMLDRLRPMALGHVPLKELLDQLVRERSRQHAEISFAFAAGDLQRSYGDSLDLTIYRCIQEGLTNVVRHASAKRVTVELSDGMTQLQLTVRDDGRGMQAGQRAGFGLRGMQERVEGLGGRYLLESAAGRGTCISITLPLDRGGPAGEKS